MLVAFVMFVGLIMLCGLAWALGVRAGARYCMKPDREDTP